MFLRHHIIVYFQVPVGVITKNGGDKYTPVTGIINYGGYKIANTILFL